MSLPAPVTLISAQVITASGHSAAFNSSGHYVDLEVEVSAVSGTTPSMTVEVQWSMDGTTFGPVDTTADAFAAITAVGNVVKQFTAKAPFFRLAWTVTGTTPSFTVTVVASDN